MGKLFYALAFVSALALSTTGCSKDKPKNQPVIQRYSVVGDPANFIAGTNANQTLDLSFFDSVKEVYLFQAYIFTNQLVANDEANEPKSQEDLEEQEKPREHEGVPAFPFKVRRVGDKVALENTNLGLSINLSRTQAILKEKDQQSLMKVEHSSVSRDNNVISIAMYGREGDDQALWVIYLAREIKPRTVKTLPNNYPYLLGFGKKVRWEKADRRPLEICVTGEDKVAKMVEMAGEQWQKALGDLMNAPVKMATNPKPFSDLNQSCVYVVDNYFTYPNPEIANYGITMPVIEFNGDVRLIDSDIVLLAKEFEKSGYKMTDKILDATLWYTIIHEMGHYLGLDHQFDGTRSVMSYDVTDMLLTDYDKKAIRALYD